MRDYQDGDEIFIKDLFELVFKQKYSLDLWHWRFIQNPAGQKKIKLMWDNDMLIGQYAVSPVSLVVDGIEVKSALSLGTMTHPNFEGKGVFKSLAKALYSDLDSEQYSSVWGFPNNNSHGGFVHSLSWENLGVQHSLEAKFQTISSKQQSVDGFEQFKFNDFTLEHENFIAGFNERNNGIWVSKSSNYLNWRFSNKPEVNYLKYFGTISDVRFLIIAKVYFDSKSGAYNLNILEFFADDFSILKSVLFNVCSGLKVEISSINIWKSLFSKDHLKFERNGFILSTPQAYVGLLPFSISHSSLLDFRLWNLNMGDSDVF